VTVAHKIASRVAVISPPASRPPRFGDLRWPAHQQSDLARGHGLGDQTLEGELVLLEILGGALVELEGGHSVADGALDLLLLATLELEGESRVGDDLLDTANV
jgi:hypothetical protein